MFLTPPSTNNFPSSITGENTEGNAEGITVIKGVDPLLDAEAKRVVSVLSGFEPGMQNGQPVPVWYMVPINFVLPVRNQ